MGDSAWRAVRPILAIGLSWLAAVGPALAQCELAGQVAPDGAAGDEFGRAVALSGNYVVIGAPFNDEAGLDAGAVYVFVREGAEWTYQAKLTADDAAANDQFGISVAIDADCAVVGAWLNDEVSQGAGAAYVFHREGALWIQEAKLTASDAAADDQFGAAVAISGNRIAVGAPLHGELPSATAGAGMRATGAGLRPAGIGLEAAGAGLTAGEAGVTPPDAGAVYVFRRGGAGWTQEAKLTASDGTAQDRLGASVAISGDVVLAGAPAAEHQGTGGSGAAYVYRRNGTSWSQEQKILPTQPEDAAQFGLAIAVSGDTGAIGAFVRDPDTGDALPTAYVYVRLGLFWSMRGAMVVGEGGTTEELGIAVALDGSTVIAGAPFDRGDLGPSGSVSVLDRAGFSWEVRKTLEASDAAVRDAFGLSVAISGDYAVAGAPRHDDGGGDSGSAYLLWASPQPDCNANGNADFCDIWEGTSLDLDSNGVPDECGCDLDVACDDGVYCNGAEVCDTAAHQCLAGAFPCTAGQACDEGNDRCVGCIDDTDCDDGRFCDGIEDCNAAGSCQPGVEPCGAGQACDDVSDRCVECQTDAHCDDGLFCTGVETCGAEGTCRAGVPPCAPGLKCDEGHDRCSRCSQDADCDDGLFCTGLETCGADGACRAGTPPCPASLTCDEGNDRCNQCSQDSDCDNGVFCNGAESCSPDRVCRPGRPACPPDEVCNETTGTCEACGDDADCGDGDRCTEDWCEAGECWHAPVVSCDRDGDGVDDEADACPNTPLGATVRADGCACHQLDEDGDGVNNCNDACPGTPRASTVDASGCSLEAPPGQPLPPDAAGEAGEGDDGPAAGSIGDEGTGDEAPGPADSAIGPGDGAASAGTTGTPESGDEGVSGQASPEEQTSATDGGARREARGGHPSGCGVLGWSSLTLASGGLALLGQARRAVMLRGRAGTTGGQRPSPRPGDGWPATVATDAFRKSR